MIALLKCTAEDKSIFFGILCPENTCVIIILLKSFEEYIHDHIIKSLKRHKCDRQITLAENEFTF